MGSSSLVCGMVLKSLESLEHPVYANDTTSNSGALDRFWMEVGQWEDHHIIENSDFQRYCELIGEEKRAEV